MDRRGIITKNINLIMKPQKEKLKLRAYELPYKHKYANRQTDN